MAFGNEERCGELNWDEVGLWIELLQNQATEIYWSKVAYYQMLIYCVERLRGKTQPKAAKIAKETTGAHLERFWLAVEKAVNEYEVQLKAKQECPCCHRDML